MSSSSREMLLYECHATTKPQSESPATEAGLRDGDRLIQVDDTHIASETPMDDIVAAVRGPEGTKTHLVIVRPPDYEELEFTVKRANIPLPSVTFYLATDEQRMGVVRVNIIASTTPVPPSLTKKG